MLEVVLVCREGVLREDFGIVEQMVQVEMLARMKEWDCVLENVGWIN